MEDWSVTTFPLSVSGQRHPHDKVVKEIQIPLRSVHSLVAFGPAVVEGMVDEEQVEGYDIFFADDCGEAMGAAIARVPRAPIMAKGGCCEVMHYTVDLAAVVPQGAAKLLVATRGIRTGKAVDINDFALGPTTTTAGRKTPVTGASACFSLWLPAMALAWVMARPLDRAAFDSKAVVSKGLSREGSNADNLKEHAWCESCQRADFGCFCPQCGHPLVRHKKAVVTPTGQWLLGEERQVKLEPRTERLHSTEQEDSQLEPARSKRRLIFGDDSGNDLPETQLEPETPGAVSEQPEQEPPRLAATSDAEAVHKKPRPPTPKRRLIFGDDSGDEVPETQLEPDTQGTASTHCAVSKQPEQEPPRLAVTSDAEGVHKKPRPPTPKRRLIFGDDSGDEVPETQLEPETQGTASTHGAVSKQPEQEPPRLAAASDAQALDKKPRPPTPKRRLIFGNGSRGGVAETQLEPETQGMASTNGAVSKPRQPKQAPPRLAAKADAEFVQEQRAEAPTAQSPRPASTAACAEATTPKPRRRTMLAVLRDGTPVRSEALVEVKEPQKSPWQGRFLSFVQQRRLSRAPMPNKRMRKKQRPERHMRNEIVVSEFGGECAKDAYQVFSNFEASGGAEPNAALARLRALKALHTGVNEFPEALRSCAQAILCAGECRSSFLLVDGCLDLLATIAQEAGAQSRLLAWLVQCLGGEAQALKDRAARCRAASLLWRLLPGPEELNSQVSRLVLDAAGMALLDLAKDKAPAIRLAATRGLSRLKGVAFRSALLRLTVDCTPAVRTAALQQLGPRADQASGRCLDAALRVRLGLFEALAQEDLPELPVEVVQIGLKDANAEVRAACVSMLNTWAARREPGEAFLLVAALEEPLAEAALRGLLALPEWAEFRDGVAARTPSDASSALIWRVATQLAPELPAEAKPLCQQAAEALGEEQFEVLRQVLRLLLEEGEGPTEDLAELALAVLRIAPARCGQRSPGAHPATSLFSLAMALLRRMVPLEELQMLVASLLEDFRYGLEAQRKLAEKTLRGLYVIEAALCQSKETLTLGENLLEDWLRPAMDHPDATPEQRALAVRCLALHGSGEEEAMTYWPFFLELLRSSRQDDIIETCGLFLTDVLLQRDGLGDAALSAWPALRSAALRAARPLRRRLAERLMTLLLYSAPGEAEIEASWSLAWLMLEAFHTEPEVCQALDLEAAEEAAFRGRLLCFFGCLGRASVAHARLMARALQLLLSTDLWRLGALQPLASGPRGAQWRLVHMPRLVRLVCQQLAASCAARRQAEHLAGFWLEQIWRPLALLCLDSAEDSSPLLAELLAAISAPLLPAAGKAPLAAANQLWPRLKQEVVESCQEIEKTCKSTRDAAQLLQAVRALIPPLAEDDANDAALCWKAKAARQSRQALRAQLQRREIRAEQLLAHFRGAGAGRKRSDLSDDDSEVPRKRVRRTLFLGTPGE
ncbi:unnamed protein product [Effrenium voratum]|uniref:Uncharacterized protein n=1 Tax=Effrenium voratum TaxID=2562239 RepID=A0AA36JDZ5_9DINO|nr:unnamed protein product [Effrenium voratum]